MRLGQSKKKNNRKIIGKGSFHQDRFSQTKIILLVKNVNYKILFISCDSVFSGFASQVQRINPFMSGCISNN